VPIVEELLRDGHALISDHTRRHLKAEIAWPPPVIDRLPLARWQTAGGPSLAARAAAEIDRLVAAYQPSGLDPHVGRALTARMQAEARRVGMDRLPELPCAA
jgi:trimethylamine:corrinoid methyltransferase-like protein